MSFLSELQQKKTKLKPTETIVTQQDGQKFLQSNSEIKKISDGGPGYVVDTKPDDKPAKIIEHLYLGSQDCCDLSVLLTYGIKHVLSLGIEAPLKSPDITYKFIRILDLTNIELGKYLPAATEFIEDCLESNQNVLVHCNAGVSRSASVVISYLMLKCNQTFEEAYQVVKQARPCIRPNDGFMVQLRRLKDMD